MLRRLFMDFGITDFIHIASPFTYKDEQGG